MNKAALQTQLSLLAGPGVLKRAEALLAGPDDRDITLSADVLRGWFGNKPIYFNLDISSDSVDYTCDCPLGEEEIFCEHCAMLALHWFNQPEKATTEFLVEDTSLIDSSSQRLDDFSPIDRLNENSSMPDCSSILFAVEHCQDAEESQPPSSIDCIAAVDRLDAASLDADEVIVTSVRLAKITDYIYAQSKEMLANRILTLAEQDRGLLDTLYEEWFEEQEETQEDRAFHRAKDFLFEVFDQHIQEIRRRPKQWQSIFSDLDELLLQFLSDLLNQSPDWAADLALQAINSATIHRRVFTLFNPSLETAIADLRSQLAEIHREACRCLKDDPQLLAGHVFFALQTASYDSTLLPLSSYLEILGPDGVDWLQIYCEDHWTKHIAPVGRLFRQSYTFSQERVLHAMESAAKLTGRLDFVRSIHRGAGTDTLDIIRECEFLERVGKSEEAFEFGENHLNDRASSMLKAFMAPRLAERGYRREAICLLYENYMSYPTGSNFEQIRSHCIKWDVNDWPSWRDKCLEVARRARRSIDGSSGMENHFLNRLLLDIFILEEDWDSAWKEVREGHATPGQVHNLCKKSWRDVPDVARAALISETFASINQRSDDSYRQARELLLLIRQIDESTGNAASFDSLITTIRSVHSLKSKLVAYLDQSGLAPSVCQSNTSARDGARP